MPNRNSKSLVPRNQSNLGDDKRIYSCGKNKKRKKMSLHPQQIEVVNQVRSWQDLPVDVLSKIFEKLGAFDIVYSAQSVCSAWRDLSKQPRFFHFIKLHPPWYLGSEDINITKIEKQIVDQSCGQLTGLSMVVYGNEEVLHYALDKPNSLKFLKLSRISADGLMNAIVKVPFLEKLILSLKCITDCSSQKRLIVEIGRSCLQLKYFSWCSKGIGYVRKHVEYEDEEVLAIAEYMPQLRELHLEGNVVTNKGLRAVLHGCPYLECLNLENCYNAMDLGEEPLNECGERIKILKLPMRRYYHGSDDWLSIQRF